MRGRAQYPMPDFEVEPPVRVDVVEKEYRQRMADSDTRERSRHRIECHAYESQVPLKSTGDPGAYPVNAAECRIYTFDATSKKETHTATFKTNTVADRRAAIAHNNATRNPLKAYGDTPEGGLTLERITLNRDMGGGRTKNIYIDMKASGGPVLTASRRDSFTEIDLHSGNVTHGCLGAQDSEITTLINALAGTKDGTLAERVEAANQELQKRKVVLTLDRDLDKQNTVWP